MNWHKTQYIFVFASNGSHFSLFLTLLGTLVNTEPFPFGNKPSVCSHAIAENLFSSFLSHDGSALLCYCEVGMQNSRKELWLYLFDLTLHYLKTWLSALHIPFELVESIIDRWWIQTSNHNNFVIAVSTRFICQMPIPISCFKISVDCEGCFISIHGLQEMITLHVEGLQLNRRLNSTTQYGP